MLSKLNKIIEKLMEFLNEQKVIYCKQYDFCKGFSTVHAIFNLIDNIKNAVDNKQFVCGVLLTCKKHLIQFITTFYFKKYNTILSEEYLINSLSLI